MWNMWCSCVQHEHLIIDFNLKLNLQTITSVVYIRVQQLLDDSIKAKKYVY